MTDRDVDGMVPWIIVEEGDITTLQTSDGMFVRTDIFAREIAAVRAAVLDEVEEALRQARIYESIEGTGESDMNRCYRVLAALRQKEG